MPPDRCTPPDDVPRRAPRWPDSPPSGSLPPTSARAASPPDRDHGGDRPASPAPEIRTSSCRPSVDLRPRRPSAYGGSPAAASGISDTAVRFPLHPAALPGVRQCRRAPRRYPPGRFLYPHHHRLVHDQPSHHRPHRVSPADVSLHYPQPSDIPPAP